MSADPAPHLSPTTTIALPWKAPSFAVVKGIIHATGAKPKMKLKSLMLSSNAAEPDIVGGASFAEIVEREAHTIPHLASNCRTILPSFAVMNRRLSAPSKISGRSARLVDTRQRRQGSRRQPELQGNDCGTPAGWNPQEIRNIRSVGRRWGARGRPADRRRADLRKPI